MKTERKKGREEERKEVGRRGHKKGKQGGKKGGGKGNELRHSCLGRQKHPLQLWNLLSLAYTCLTHHVCHQINYFSL
jgi:hypothetical protein